MYQPGFSAGAAMSIAVWCRGWWLLAGSSYRTLRTLALITGALTWLVLTGRGELAPPRRHPR